MSCMQKFSDLLGLHHTLELPDAAGSVSARPLLVFKKELMQKHSADGF